MIARLGLTLASVPAIVAGTMAHAENALPEGCTQFLTVQMSNCRVATHHTCPTTPGDRWRVIHTQSGPVFTSRIDAEAQWLWSRDLPNGPTDRTVLPAPDPSSMTELLETGRDTFVFVELRDNGQRRRVEGFDELTGETVEIDGEPLLRTRFQYRVIDADTGRLLDYARGREFVSERHRRFFSGITTFPSGSAEVTVDSTPAEFIYPGEPGFDSVMPNTGCDPMISLLGQDWGHA